MLKAAIKLDLVSVTIGHIETKRCISVVLHCPEISDTDGGLFNTVVSAEVDENENVVKALEKDMDERVATIWTQKKREKIRWEDWMGIFGRGMNELLKSRVLNN
jgi:hypothetical protein